jgi:hypothetical protein
MPVHCNGRKYYSPPLSFILVALSPDLVIVLVVMVPSVPHHHLLWSHRCIPCTAFTPPHMRHLDFVLRRPHLTSLAVICPGRVIIPFSRALS